MPGNPTEERKVHLDKEKLTGWNLNTIVIAVGMIAQTLAVGNWVGKYSTRLDALEQSVENYRRTQDQVNKDYVLERKTSEATVWARLNQQDKDLSRIANLEYRITVTEQGAINTTRALENLQTALNNLGADIRVIREIQERNEPRTRTR